MSDSRSHKPLKTGRVELTVLGSGDAFSSHGRLMSGYLIDGGPRILLEAGPTVLTALKQARVPTPEIDLVLISHPHGDHFGGLPFLILEYMWERPRRNVLTIAGPRNLGPRTWRLFRTMYPGSDCSRVSRWLRFVELEPGETKRFGSVRVSAIRTPHMRRDKSLAFRIEVGGRVIAFSGDSGWTDELIPLCAGADLFLCECTYFDSAQLDFHLNYPLLLRMRDRLDVKRLVLTHLGREVLDRAEEVRFEMATDGMRIEL
jgi:ribonuclease BN (tRNA processing enzyme)